MPANTSTAVMARRAEAPDSLDFYPTPPWAGRAFCEWLATQVPGGLVGLEQLSVEDPACGHGDLLHGLGDYFGKAIGADIFDYRDVFPEQQRVEDFLFAALAADSAAGVDWVVTNPPFRLGEEFVRAALLRARRGVAMLLRTNFLESEGRQALFTDLPPTDVLTFSERVVMARGRLRDPDVKYWDAQAKKWKTPSSATSYSWFVWNLDRPVAAGAGAYRGAWIGAQRRALTRAGDYPPLPEGERGPVAGGALI